MWIVSCSQVGHRACCRLKVAASCFLISFLKTDLVDFQALRCPDVILWQKSTGISSSLSVTSIVGSGITACLCLQYRAWWFWRRRKTQGGSLEMTSEHICSLLYRDSRVKARPLVRNSECTPRSNPHGFRPPHSSDTESIVFFRFLSSLE